MEWETVDMEGIIKETQKAREIVCQAMDIDEDSSEEAEKPHEAALSSPSSGVTVVIDTNVFISRLAVVTSLLATAKVRVLLAWMVVKELDNLKTSTRDHTGARARAAVRLIHNLLSRPRPANLLTQNGRESRAVAASPSRSSGISSQFCSRLSLVVYPSSYSTWRTLPPLHYCAIF